MTARLFTPLRLRELELGNRIVVAPMCQYLAEDGNAGDWHRMHLGQLGTSGAGLLIAEATAVSAGGRITPSCLGLYSDDNVRSLAPIIAFIRRNSPMRLAVQLSHAGRKASRMRPWEGGGLIPPAEGGWTCQAPSALAQADGEAPPMAMSLADIETVTQQFVAAAGRALQAGFDAIEVHAAHGYLLHQFLSPLSNHRQDRYGGSLDNRMRLVLEVFERVRDFWPAALPVGVRISATDWVDGGWDLEQSVRLATELRRLGCDWIDVSSGGLSPLQRIAVTPGYQVPFAGRIRAATGMTTMAVGMISEPAQAESILQQGQADLVALATGFLREPRWPWRAARELGGRVHAPLPYRRKPRPGEADIFMKHDGT